MAKHKLFKRIAATLMLTMTCAVASVSAAPATEGQGAIMKPPAKNAAVVADMPGFQNAKYQTFFKSATVNEGLVIRQSYVKDGKIVIPKAGMYYTTRTNPIHLLSGEKTMILGKLYTVVDTDNRFDVISNVDMKHKQVITMGDGSKGLEAEISAKMDNGYPIVKNKFQILKASGNYYGTAFPVSVDSSVKDITKGSLKKGTGKATGGYYPGEGSDWTREFFDRSANTSGQTYLVVDKGNDKMIHLKEFGTPAVENAYITDKDVVELVLAPGETGKVGEYTVKVTDVKKDTATVELVSKDGVVTKKVLGPFNEKNKQYLPTDHIARTKMLVKSESKDAQVALDIFRNPFRNGKVALIGYYDIKKVESGKTFFGDARFLARPDT